LHGATTCAVMRYRGGYGIYSPGHAGPADRNYGWLFAGRRRATCSCLHVVRARRPLQDLRVRRPANTDRRGTGCSSIPRHCLPYRRRRRRCGRVHLASRRLRSPSNVGRKRHAPASAARCLTDISDRPHRGRRIPIHTREAAARGARTRPMPTHKTPLLHAM